MAQYDWKTETDLFYRTDSGFGCSQHASRTLAPGLHFGKGGIMSARTLTLLALSFGLATGANAARQPGEPFRPGMNFFSKQQDVQLGQEAAQEVRKKYPVGAQRVPAGLRATDRRAPRRRARGAGERISVHLHGSAGPAGERFRAARRSDVHLHRTAENGGQRGPACRRHGARDVARHPAARHPRGVQSEDGRNPGVAAQAKSWAAARFSRL